MKLTCHTSAVGNACRFEETNSLRSWTEYALTVVSEKFRDYGGQNATATVKSVDGTVTYATCTLTPDPISRDRNKRYGTLILSSANVQEAFEDRMAELGVDFGPVLTTFHLTVTIGPATTVIIDTDVPVTLAARIGGDGEATPGISVDDALSSVSTNPVQNKVVTLALDGYATAAQIAAVSPAAEAVRTAIEIESAARTTYLNYVSNSVRSTLPNDIQSAIDAKDALVQSICAERCDVQIVAHDSNTLVAYDSRYPYNGSAVATSHPDLREKLAFRISYSSFSTHAGNTTIHVSASDKALWNDVYDLVRLHVTNDYIHINGQERDAWNLSLSDAQSSLTRHVSDLTAVKHLTQAQRAAFVDFAAKFVLHAEDADQFPPGYGTPNHVSDAKRLSWNGAITSLATHAALYNDGAHIDQYDRISWNEFASGVSEHTSDAEIHPTSVEKARWNLATPRYNAHTAATNVNPHYVTCAELGTYTSGAFDAVVDGEICDAMDDYLDEVGDEYSSLFRFKGTIDTTALLPSSAYAKPGDAWRIVKDRLNTKADGTTVWQSAVYVYDEEGNWNRTGADVEQDFSDIATTTYATTQLSAAVTAHASAVRPHDNILSFLEDHYGERIDNATADVEGYDASLLKNGTLTAHVALASAHGITLGQLLDGEGGFAGTPESSVISALVTSELAYWKTEIDQLIVGSDLQCAVKYKGVIGVPLVGSGTKTIEYGTTDVETEETVDEAKYRLGQNATSGDLYSVYGSPIMYVYGGGTWHTIGFQVDQSVVNTAAERVTKLGVWGKYPYNPSAPNPADTGYVAPEDYEAGHDTDNTAHHSSQWFLAWQNVRENLVSYKVMAFLPEALDRLAAQEIDQNGFTVNSDGLVCKNVSGTLVPYLDYEGKTVASDLAAGTVATGVSATQALINTVVSNLMPGFATQGSGILFSYVLGNTVSDVVTGDFGEGITVSQDGSLVDAVSGNAIVDSQGNPVFEGYHRNVAQFDDRRLRVTWNPVAGLEGGGIHWTPDNSGASPTGTMSIPLYTVDKDGNLAGLLDITSISSITSTYTTLVTTSPAPSVGAKYWCKAVSKLFSYNGVRDTSKDKSTLDELVSLAFQNTAYVYGTTILSSRTYTPARYDRYWVSGKSRLFYFKGRGDISSQMTVNGRYTNVDCAVTDLDALARVAVNRGNGAIPAPTAGQTPEVMQTQRFYVRSTNKMYVFNWTANHQLTQAQLDAVSTRLATDGHTAYTENELQSLGFTASASTSCAENFLVDDMARFGWVATDLVSTDLARFGWELASANCWNTPTTKAYVREIITGSASAPATGEDIAAGNVAQYFSTESAKKCVVLNDGTVAQKSVLKTAPFSPLALSKTASGTTITCYKGVPQLNVYHSSPTLVSGYNGDQVMILRKTRTIVGEYVLTSEAVENEDGGPIDIVYCRDGGLWYKRDEITADLVINRLKFSIAQYFDERYSIPLSRMQTFDRACQSDPISGFLWYHRTMFDSTTSRMFELVFRFCIDNTGLNSEEWTVFETTNLAPAEQIHGYCSYSDNGRTRYKTLVSGFNVATLFDRVKSGLFVIEVSCTSNNRMMVSAGGGHNARWLQDTRNHNRDIGSTYKDDPVKADYVLLNPDRKLADGTQYPFHFAATVFKNRNAVVPDYNTDIFTVPDVDPASSSEIESLYWLITGTVRYSSPVLTVFDWRHTQVLLYVLDGNEITPQRTNLRGVRTLGANGTPAPLTSLSESKRLYTKATMSIQMSNNASYPADCGVLLQVDSYVWFFKYSQLNFEFELLASRRFLDYRVGTDGTDLTYSSQSSANGGKSGDYNVVIQTGTSEWKVGKDYSPTALGFYCHFAVGENDTNSFKLVATTDSFIYFYVVDEANHRFIDNPLAKCLMPNPHYEVDNYAEFSEAKTYAVGDRVQYDDYVYRCTSAIATPGPWNSTKWTGEFETFEGRHVVARRGLLDGSIKQWKTTPVQAVFGKTDFVCTAYMQKGNLDRYQPAVLDYDGQRTDYGGRSLKAYTLVLMKGFRKFRVFMANGVLSSEEILSTDNDGRNNGKDVFYTTCSAGHKVGVLGERGKTYKLQCPHCKTTNVVTIKGVSED